MSKPIFKEAKVIKEILPPPSLTDLNSTFKWTRGSDVQKTWRRFGWQPPSEYRTDYLFKQNREATLND